MSKRGHFSRRLFVFGYPGAVTHGELTTQFEEFGRIVATRMNLPSSSGSDDFPYTFIEFNSSIDATTARTKMHNAHVRGQRIQVHFDNKIPNQYKPSSLEDRDFLEPVISPPPPPPPPHNMRRSSNESSIHSSQSHIASPQSSPGERYEYRRDRGQGGSFKQPAYYHDRRGDGAYESRQSPYPHPRNGGYAGQQDRRWNGSERMGGGPMRHRPGGRYPGGGGPHRPYNRGPMASHGPSSRYDNHGPRSSYGRPSHAARHYRDGGDERRDDYTPSYEDSYESRADARSRSPPRRGYYRDGNEREDSMAYGGPGGLQERDYDSVTPQRSRSSSRIRGSRRTNSQVSLDLCNDGGSWQDANPKDAGYGQDDDGDDSLYTAAPEVRPKDE